MNPHSITAAAVTDAIDAEASGAFNSKLLHGLPASTYSRESAGGGTAAERKCELKKNKGKYAEGEGGKRST